MKIFLASLLIALLLASCTSAAVVNDNDDYTSETETTTEYTTTEEETTAPPPPPVTIDSMVWRVAPTLNIERLWRCECGEFRIDDTWYVIEPETLNTRAKNEHGPWDGPRWFYDPTRELFGNVFFGSGYDFGYGMHPIDNFARSLEMSLNDYLQELTSLDARTWSLGALETANRRMIVQQVQATQLYSEVWGVEWDDARSNYLDRFAIFENRQPISPWFDEITWGESNELFAAQQGDTWQFINQYGEPLLPMQFEHIVLIDDKTAFVRHNGRYGILDIPATAANL